mmetsp:Transcript_48601/g.128876  ORF Transcript_48601/g.128876 Transcript_48601/m.128876 type:complete len:86 (+) Transcript_48601:149-406(+)
MFQISMHTLHPTTNNPCLPFPSATNLSQLYRYVSPMASNRETTSLQNLEARSPLIHEALSTSSPSATPKATARDQVSTQATFLHT